MSGSSWEGVSLNREIGSLELTQHTLSFHPAFPPSSSTVTFSLDGFDAKSAVFMKKGSNDVKIRFPAGDSTFSFSSSRDMQDFTTKLYQIISDLSSQDVQPLLEDKGESPSLAVPSLAPGNDVEDSSSESSSISPSSSPTDAFNHPILNVSVSKPAQVSDKQDVANVFVVFSVTTTTNLQQYKSEKRSPTGLFIWRSHRRFSEFELLRETLVKTYPRAAIPQLPGKAWINRFNPSFLEQRSRELQQFLSDVSSNPSLINSAELADFLKSDPHLSDVVVDESNKPKNGIVDTYIRDNPLTSVLEQTLLKAYGSASKNALPKFHLQMDQDYYDVKEIANRWQFVPPKLPFEKFVILNLGTTSAGKSSFVNYFFSLQIKKEANAQQDSCFTIVETVPENVFSSYMASQTDEKREFSPEELSASVDDVYSDHRYGHVFLYLDTATTLSRYFTQLHKYSELIHKFHLFQTVLMNEKYLPEKGPFSDYITKTILIDSPGFGSESVAAPELIETFLGNLKILQALYALSDINLFLIPATQLNMVSNQLSVLELSVLYSAVGEERMGKIIRKALRTEPRERKSLLASLATRVVGKLPSDTASVYQGTSTWEKTIFILSKVDLLTQNEATMRAAFYELGGLFCKSFAHLPNPVPDSIITLSLPHKSRENVPSQLNTLIERLKARARQSPYEKRVEVAIQEICNALLPVITKSWSKFISSDKDALRSILERSVNRLRNLQAK